MKKLDSFCIGNLPTPPPKWLFLKCHFNFQPINNILTNSIFNMLTFPVSVLFTKVGSYIIYHLTKKSSIKFNLLHKGNP